MARNCGHLSLRNIQRMVPKLEFTMASGSGKRSATVDYRQLNNLSSSSHKRGKYYDVERLISRRRSRHVSSFSSSPCFVCRVGGCNKIRITRVCPPIYCHTTQ